MRNLINVLFVALLLSVGACKKSIKTSPGVPHTVFGETKPFLNGVARSFVVLNTSGNPTAAGIRFSHDVLTALPIDAPGKFTLSLPNEAAAVGLNHIELEWRPTGDYPNALYYAPHFDFRFSRVSAAELAEIPASDTKPANSMYVPKNFYAIGGSVAGIGRRYIDSTALESKVGVFNHAMVLNFFEGKFLSHEVMITQALLLSKIDNKVIINLPQAVQQTGYYPTASHLAFDATTNEYEVTLENLALINSTGK